MIIFPAIDIKQGQCVRLFKGDFATVEKVAENPLDTAKAFAQAGATWLHMVDLDGALQGKPVNSDIFINIAQQTALQVQVGGGIRDMDTIDYYLSQGIARVILGSAVIGNAQFVAQAVKKYGQRIAVGIDAKDELVRAAGWVENSQVHYLTLAKEMEDVGVQYLIYTDISKDGTLAGPNMTQLRAINQAVDCHIIASGGIRDITNIQQLQQAGLYGAICGQSLYKGTLQLTEALTVAKGE